jgi:hypothetical protein
MTNTFVIAAIVVAVLFFVCLPFIGKKIHKKHSVMKADRELRISKYNDDRRIRNANSNVKSRYSKVAYNAANVGTKFNKTRNSAASIIAKSYRNYSNRRQS